MTSDADVAGVVAPPPLILLVCLGAGVAVDRGWPQPLGLSGSWRLLGPGVVAGGLGLAGLAFREFVRAKTSPRPDRPTTAIIAQGPFCMTRNPAYLAMLLLLIGVALWMNSAAVLAMVVPLFLILDVGVVAREERYLERKFGQDYLDYKASVRRWL